MLPDLENAEEETAVIARAYATLVTDDDSIDYYTMFGPYEGLGTRFFTDLPQWRDYRYRFVRLINGEPTSDYIEVEITPKGHLTSLYIGDTEAYPVIEEGIDRFSNVNIRAYMKELFDEAYPENGSEPEFKEIEYALTPGGDVVIVVEAYIKTSGDVAVGGKFILK